MDYLRKHFQEEADSITQDYLASIPFDQRLYRQDIEGSIAHTKMLAKQGIVTDSDARSQKAGIKFLEG